jgi:hypothetical protein
MSRILFSFLFPTSPRNQMGFQWIEVQKYKVQANMPEAGKLDDYYS